MRLVRPVPEQSLAVLGVLGQAAFYAPLGRAHVPVGVRVAVHLALAVSLVLVGPPPGASAEGPPARRADRLAQVGAAGAAALYLALTLGSLALVVRGFRAPGLLFFLVLESLGAAVAAVVLTQALRFLAGPRRGPAERLFEAPWAGAYRTRPAVPWEPPPAPPPAAPNPGREALANALISLALTAGGAIVAWHPRHAGDRFWGLCNVGFFGLCTWVLAAQAGSKPPTAREARRFLGVTAITGLLALTLAALSHDVGTVARIGVGAAGVLTAAGAGWAHARTRSRHGR